MKTSEQTVKSDHGSLLLSRSGKSVLDLHHDLLELRDELLGVGAAERERDESRQ